MLLPTTSASSRPNKKRSLSVSRPSRRLRPRRTRPTKPFRTRKRSTRRLWPGKGPPTRKVFRSSSRPTRTPRERLGPPSRSATRSSLLLKKDGSRPPSWLRSMLRPRRASKKLSHRAKRRYPSASRRSMTILLLHLVMRMPCSDLRRSYLKRRENVRSERKERKPN